ncbi:eIF2A-related protein [Nostoc sp. FACHB-280]|uniref:nSTAND1 domain-containing NTPase n=1 Tax=Nostoc sp. FACHB-280 TaxID=2692839 RepID=UPI00168BC1BF|nr:hypothetical protein [Nostoc sp. FACHB-280]MBD2494503.1 hypothetical protein [Nostoc sp. FACHB-280]
MNTSNIGQTNSIQVTQSTAFQVGDNNRQTNIFYGDDPEEEKVSDTIDENSPYLGLESFTANDSNRFYGRKKLIIELLEHLENNNLIFLLGASGSGKSSLVKAGIIPKFSQKTKLFAELSFVPGDDPFDAFFDELQTSVPKQLKFYNKSEIKKIIKTVDNLKLNSSSIIEKLRYGKNDSWIIFIDQFEEIFSQTTDENERILFINNLNSLINLQSEGQDNYLKIILAMRTDFLDHLTPFPEFQKAIEGNIRFITEMTDRELKLVIRNPAATHGVNVDKELIEEIINDFRGKSRSLPLLQYTLDLLWQKHNLSDRFLNKETYKNLGRVGGALQQQAEKIYKLFESQGQGKAVEDIFIKLITITGDGKRVSKRENKSKFISEDEALATIVNELINDHRLLISGRQKDTVEIAHEALIDSWSRLQDWITKHEEQIILERQLKESATIWQKFKPDQKKAVSELWRGFKLERVLELQKEKAFGELEPYINEFIKASIDDRNRQLVQEQENQERERHLTQVNLEKEVAAAIANSRNDLSNNNNLEALTKLIEVGKILQKSPDSKISADIKLHFLITFGQIFNEIAEKNSFQGHKDCISGVSFSPDSQIIASSSDDKTVKLWSINGDLLQTLNGHEDEVMDVSFSPDGEMLASASRDKTIKLWKKTTDATTQWILDKTLQGHSHRVIGVSFSPDSQIIASASQDKTVRLWNRNGTLLNIFSGHEDGVINVAFSPDGKLIASASKDHTIKLWDLLEKKELKGIPKEHSHEVSAVSFGSDSKTLISCGWDNYVRFWKRNGNVTSMINKQYHIEKFNYVTFSPDGETVAAASEDGLITLWDKNCNFKIIFKGNKKSVTKVSFSADSKTLVSGSLDGTIKIWDCTRKFNGHSSEIFKIDFSLDGETIVTASADGTVKLWQRNSELLSSFPVNDNSIDLKINPKRDIIATASQNEVKIWNFKGKKQESFSEYNSLVRSINFNPEGTEIAIGYVDGTVILWNIDDDENRVLAKHTEQVNMLTFSPQGTMIATASADKTIKLWDLNGESLAHREYENYAYYVSFSHDGGLIATANMTANKTHQIEIWKANNNNIYKQTPLGNFDKKVMSIGFISDSNIVASISEHQTITLWNTADGRLLKSIEGNNNSSVSAACIFSSQNDKSAIAVANSENRISLWSLSLDELLSNSNNQISDYTKRLSDPS